MLSKRWWPASLMMRQVHCSMIRQRRFIDFEFCVRVFYSQYGTKVLLDNTEEPWLATQYSVYPDPARTTRGRRAGFSPLFFAASDVIMQVRSNSPGQWGQYKHGFSAPPFLYLLFSMRTCCIVRATQSFPEGEVYDKKFFILMRITDVIRGRFLPLMNWIFTGRGIS